MLTAREDIVLIDVADMKEVEVTGAQDLQLVYHSHFGDFGGSTPSKSGVETSNSYNVFEHSFRAHRGKLFLLVRSLYLFYCGRKLMTPLSFFFRE